MAFAVPKGGKGNNVESPTRDASRTLPESRRNKLLDLKKREEMKDVLRAKLTDRYANDGDTSPNSKKKYTAAIDNEVENFLDNATITENNLKRLERKVEQKTGKADDMASVSNYSVASSRMSAGKPAAGGVQKTWKAFDEYAVYMHEIDAVRHTEKVRNMREIDAVRHTEKLREQQKRLHKELDDQVHASRSRNFHARDEDMKFAEIQGQELEQFRKDEEEKLRDVKSKNIAEKHMRDEQLAYEKKIKAEEQERKTLEETLAVKRIQKEIEVEKLRLEQKKVDQKKAMAKVFVENQENRAKKDAAKKVQVEKDIAAMKEYNRILDAQELKRQQAKDAQAARQKYLMERMKDTVLAQQESKGAEDEIRAQRQKDEADERALELHTNKMAKLKDMRWQTKEYLLSQIADKNSKKRQALELKQLQAGILHEDTEHYELAEKEKVHAKKLRNLEHKYELQKQIQAKEARETNIEMSEAESKMNKDLLELVHETLSQRNKAAGAAVASAQTE